MKKLIKHLIILIVIIVFAFIALQMFLYNYMYPMNYKDEILSYSKEYEIDPYLVYAIINVESNFNPEVKSNANAKGLMQIMDITADWAKEHIELEDLSEEDFYKPEINIKIGCWYISKLSNMYDNNVEKIAAAYNAGAGNVNKWIDEGKDISNGDIPFEETKKYVEKVKSNIDIYQVLYGDSYTKQDAYNAGVKICDMVYNKLKNKLNHISNK